MQKANKSRVDAVKRVRTANEANRTGVRNRTDIGTRATSEERTDIPRKNNVANMTSGKAGNSNINKDNTNNRTGIKNATDTANNSDKNNKINNITNENVTKSKKKQKVKVVKGYKKTIYNENPYNKNRNIRKKRFRRKRAIICASIVGGIVIIVAVGYMTTHKDNNTYHYTEYSGIEKDGLDVQKSINELQKRLEEKAEEEEVSFKINTAPTFEDATSKGDLYIENSAGNSYNIQVKIVLDDTDETVLETDVLEPGDMITTMALDKELEAGDYEATAFFDILDMDTGEVVDTVENAITITIQE